MASSRPDLATGFAMCGSWLSWCPWPRDVVERAVERLKEAGLLEVLADDERGYESWRINEASLAAVTR